MNVIRLNENYREQYSQFVAAHLSGSFLQSWSWGDFQSTQGKTAVRYGLLNENNQLVATTQFLQTNIPHLPGTYMYAPYGPLISDELHTATAIPQLTKKLQNDFPKLWFIRLEPKDELPLNGTPTTHIQPGSTLITDITKTEEQLLEAMHQKTRYNIKVAAKHEIKIKNTSDANSESTAQAINLLTETGLRQGYKGHSDSYYKQLLSFFDNSEILHDMRVSLYKAMYNSQCVASAIMIDHGTSRTYLFGGSDNAHRHLMAPYALHWQAIRDAKAAGMTTYDWWGTETASGTTPGFVQFKLRWGGTQKCYPGAQDIVFNKLWYRAYKALRKVNRLV